MARTTAACRSDRQPHRVVSPRTLSEYGDALSTLQAKSFLREQILHRDSPLDAPAVFGLDGLLFLQYPVKTVVIQQSDIRNVVFKLPDKLEADGYSKATKALLDGNKLSSLGWRSQYTIEDGIKKVLEMME